MKRLVITGILLAGVAAIASCGGGGSAPPTPAGTYTADSTRQGNAALDAALRPASCYTKTFGSTYTASATVTFYGWPDNSPPGAAIAHPVIHSVAGGDGSYCNPTTFATEPTAAENAKLPYGIVIYVPYLQKYFLREDDCTTSGFQGLGCSGLWTDLWIGGDAKSNFNAVINCENSLTQSGNVNIIVNPPNNEPVAWTGPIWSDSLGCNKGGTTPTPSPSPTPHPTPTPTGHPTPTPTPTGRPTPTPTPGGGNLSATVAFYSYFDNSPVGCAIAHPVIHQCAGGTGTYSDPITFATSTANNAQIPYGSIIYVPFMQRYFIREDDGGGSGITVTLWVGGNSSDVKTDVEACEAYLTPTSNQNIILNPPSNEPVTSLGQIWNESNGMCNGTYNY